MVRKKYHTHSGAVIHIVSVLTGYLGSAVARNHSRACASSRPTSFDSETRCIMGLPVSLTSKLYVHTCSPCRSLLVGPGRQHGAVHGVSGDASIISEEAQPTA